MAASEASDAAALAIDQLIVVATGSGNPALPLDPAIKAALSFQRALLTGEPAATLAAHGTPEVLLPGGRTIGEGDPILAFGVEHPHVLEWLLTQQIDRDGGNTFGKTALMYASQYDLVESIRTLLRHDIEVNARTTTNQECGFAVTIGDRTALMYAAENAASPESVRLLVEAGADTEAHDSAGRSAEAYLNKNSRLSDADREGIRRILTHPSRRKR